MELRFVSGMVMQLIIVDIRVFHRGLLLCRVAALTFIRVWHCVLYAPQICALPNKCLVRHVSRTPVDSLCLLNKSVLGRCVQF